MLVVAFAFFPLPLYASPPDDHADLRVLHSDDTGIAFEYTPGAVSRDTVSLAGDVFDVLSIASCVYATEPGQPQIPQRHVLIGIPPDASPTVTVHEAVFQEWTGYRLAPAPATGANRLAVLDSTAYAASAFSPAQRVMVGAPGVFRGCRVLTVTVLPVAYSPATRRVRLYNRIRVEVRFNREGRTGALSSPADDRLRSVYAAALLNADAAARWRVPATPATRWRRVTAFGPGEWFKVKLTETGFYRIDRETLQNAGVDVDALDPRTVRMFNVGGRALPLDVDAARPELVEIPVRVAGEADGTFDDADYILFYGTALHGWDYETGAGAYVYFQNPYTDINVYWLNTGGATPGRRMQTRDGRLAGGTVQPDTPARIHEERELINPIDSGTEWFWHLFDGAFHEEATFQVDAGTVTRGGLVTAKFRFQSKTRFLHHVQVFINDAFVGEQRWSGESVPVLISGTGAWLRNGANTVRIVLPRAGQSATQPDHVYLDWFELAYWKPVDAESGDLVFEQDLQTGGAAIRYPVTGAPADAETFDVTDPLNVTRVLTETGGSFRDAAGTGAPNRYRLVTPARWKQPVSVVRDAGSDLRNPANGADYILLTHDDFADAVEPLRAHRETHSGLRVFAANVSDVYDEFAGGLVDPTAIRDFLRYAAFNWTSGAPPAFVLLVGDGTYDYKNHSRNSPGTWIPPFEQGERCADDFFVYFDGNGDPLSGDDIFPDMAIGRLPAQTPEEAATMAQKIIAYESAPEFGVWRNTIVLTADDERTPGVTFEEPWHTLDTERLDRDTIPASFRVEKVYLTEFPLDAAGEKPGAREALINRINAGALLVNFVGHGAANLWTHERIFNTGRDLPSIANPNRLSVFVTATCTAGRFDLVTEEAMAEAFLRAEDKGAVAFVGATRLSFPSPNAALNRFLYREMLLNGAPIGAALMTAKIRTINRENSEKYVLFGDPAMRLGAPEKSIRFSDDSSDTLKVLHAAVVRGDVVNDDDTADRTFNGTAFVHTFDSARQTTYVTPRGGQIPYRLPGSNLFRGPVPVNQGAFTASFIIPRDITYGGNMGRVTVYASDAQTDASGTLDRLPLRGADPAVRDTTGPAIEALIDGRPVTDGDFISPTPTLTLILFDESGINVTGEVGHQITIQTDDDIRARQDVTALFVYDLGSFQRGSLTYTLPVLTPGDHPVTIRVWDNFNNASTAQLTLTVVEETDLRITNIMNYPNPFEQATTFTFELTQDADVTIQVYTVAGVLIRSFDGVTGMQGFNQVDWDGRDRDGDRLANGAYLYKITARARSPEKKTASAFGRLLVVR